MADLEGFKLPAAPRPGLSDIPDLARAYAPSLIEEAKNFLTENERNLKYLSYVSWAILALRCIVLLIAMIEFYHRDKGLRRAKTDWEVEKERGRWQLKFGEIGLIDLISGLLFSVALTLVTKAVTKAVQPKFAELLKAAEAVS